MHILFLTHYFPPEVNAPASRTYEHAKRWVRNSGVKVTVVTNHPNHPKGVLFPGYKNRWISIEEVDHIAVRRVKTLLAANSAVFLRTLNYLFFVLAAIAGSLRVRNPDVIVATSPQFLCAVAGYLVARLKRRPFVFELRDLWPDSIVTVGAMKPSWTIRQLEKLELYLYRQAALVITVTESFKENLVERGIPAGKIAVIRNSADLEFFKPGPAPTELSLRLDTRGKFVVAYIGTIGMAHSVDTIVESATLLRDRDDILFLIVGEGAKKASVEALVKERRLQNMKVLPGVNKAELTGYYSLSDLNLVTLRDRPLFRSVIPSKIFEIMAMGRPILSTVDGESRKILQSAGAAEFTRAESPEELAEAILRMSSDRNVLARMGASGRAFVEQHYNRDRLAEQCLKLLQNLTARDQARQSGDS
jgi:colanic acid biosynthesis glycosyl transferase WcaI